MTYEEFRKRCNTLGLSARKCHETHWQILIEGDPLVNLWPTTNRWAPANNKPGTKAQRGGIVPALAWCKKYVDGCPTKPRLPHELVTEVDFVGPANPERSAMPKATAVWFDETVATNPPNIPMDEVKEYVKRLVDASCRIVVDATSQSVIIRLEKVTMPCH